MSTPADRFTAAVAGEVLAAQAARGALLQSIVETARAIFAARGASIALLDERRGDLVFHAVAGEASDTVLGMRFSAGEGLAGSVAESGEPLIVDDLSGDPRFARGLAEQTGYVPRAMMLAPLLHGERTLGVLSVLDRGITARTTMQELDLLVAFAAQAALALEAGEAARRAGALLEQAADEDPGLAALVRLARSLEAGSEERRDASHALLSALADVVSRT